MACRAAHSPWRRALHKPQRHAGQAWQLGACARPLTRRCRPPRPPPRSRAAPPGRTGCWSACGRWRMRGFQQLGRGVFNRQGAHVQRPACSGARRRPPCWDARLQTPTHLSVGDATPPLAMTLTQCAPRRSSSRAARRHSPTPSHTRPMPRSAAPHAHASSPLLRKSPCPPVWLSAWPARGGGVGGGGRGSPVLSR